MAVAVAQVGKKEDVLGGVLSQFGKSMVMGKIDDMMKPGGEGGPLGALTGAAGAAEGAAPTPPPGSPTVGAGTKGAPMSVDPNSPLNRRMASKGMI